MKRKLLFLAPIAGLSIMLAACGQNTVTNVVDTDSIEQTETSLENPEDTTPDSIQTTSEDNTNVTEETYKPSEGTGVKYTDYYDGDILSFEIPNGMWGETFSGENQGIRLFYQDDNFATPVMTIIEDVDIKSSIFWPDFEAVDAKTAADWDYQNYIDSGLKGYGYDVVLIDGQEAYFTNMQEKSYKGYADSPKSTLVLISYVKKDPRVQDVVESIKFKR